MYNLERNHATAVTISKIEISKGLKNSVNFLNHDSFFVSFI